MHSRPPRTVEIIRTFPSSNQNYHAAIFPNFAVQPLKGFLEVALPRQKYGRKEESPLGAPSRASIHQNLQPMFCHDFCRRGKNPAKTKFVNLAAPG